MPFASILTSPLGKIGILINSDHQLTHLKFLADSTPIQRAATPSTQHIVDELIAYFQHPQQPFTASYLLAGTPFQQKVWRALTNIPVGQTRTYGELAAQLQTSPRAIGQACRTNPIPIIIPCHRIIAANHLGGYAGAREGRLMQIKEWLLQHENQLASSL